MTGKVGIGAGLAWSIGSLGIPGLVLAASFDCKQAASPREALICQDPALSDLDGRLGRAYRERQAVLTSHGAELLQSSQRSWLHYIATVCPLDVSNDAIKSDGRRDPKKCLADRYRDRLDQLATVGQRLGPFLFTRIDLFAAEPAPDAQTGATPGFYVQHVAYPQIDSPVSPEADIWNRQNLKVLTRSDDCGQGGDDDTDYVVGYANRHMISMAWHDYFYCHGTPHGMFGVRSQNTVLLPKSRALTTDDVFGANDRWTTRLQKLFWDALAKAGWTPVGDPTPSDIEDDFVQPGSWLFTKEGLNVSFSAYEGGCYACIPNLGS
jgi:uncharacterized protein